MDMNIVFRAIQNEMQPSMGCTEPVAIGLAVSRTCEYLEQPAEGLDMVISSNIFKNAYSVQIPNAGTNGIELSCALGFLLSKPGNTMEIFADVKPEHVVQAQKLVADGFVKVKVLPSSQFYIECTASNGKESAHTITEDSHDNMVFAEKDGKTLVDERADIVAAESHGGFDITQHTFAEFLQWANEVDPKDLGFIKEGIEMNLAISEIGMKQKYAIGVGPALKNLVDAGKLSNDMVTDVKRTVAAACDFRMSGGNGSVMTYLGSGNQGIETMLPIAVVAKHLGVSEEKMLRGIFGYADYYVSETSRWTAFANLRRDSGWLRQCGRHGIYDGRQFGTNLRRGAEHDGRRCRYFLRWCKGRLRAEAFHLRRRSGLFRALCNGQQHDTGNRRHYQHSC